MDRRLQVTASKVVSEQAATEMATGVARLLDAEVTVATTGVIGDSPHDGVPPGTVIVATSVDATVRVCRLLVEGSSEEMCEQAIGAALEAYSPISRSRGTERWPERHVVAITNFARA